MSGPGFSAADAERWIPRLRRYALALTGRREVADDLVQDTLERAWRKRALWNPGTDLRAWLFTVMHNVYVTGVRAARPTESLDDSSDSSTALSADWFDASTAALAAIAPSVGLEQMAYAEAAGVLGVPIGTVMSRLARGREQLRALLARDAAPPAGATALRRVK